MLKGSTTLQLSSASSAKSLSSLIDTLKSSKKLVFVGGSMGAYAALAFAGLMKNVDNVITFGPELLLGLDGGYGKKHLKDILTIRSRI